MLRFFDALQSMAGKIRSTAMARLSMPSNQHLLAVRLALGDNPHKERCGRVNMQIHSGISAVVTGGASGLGLASVRALRATGAGVSIFDFDAENGRRVATETGAVFCQVDVTSDISLDAGFAQARAANGQERILIACAGGGGGPTPTLTGDAASGFTPARSELFQQILALNIGGTFAAASRFAAGAASLEPIDGERGVAIFTASVAADDGQESQAAYAAAKAGIKGMTLSIARDLGRHAIRVNCIQPGPFATPAVAKAPTKMIEDLVEQLIFPERLGDPAEYASAALEMIRNPFFNATSIRIDGGIRLPNWIG